MSDAEPGPDTSEAGKELTSERVLNAAVAFAGHVATAAEQAAAQGGAPAQESVTAAVLRQYLQETATLCLRRLAELYAAAADDPQQVEVASLLREGAERARATTAAAEALGDLGLDLLDRLLE